MFTDLTGQAKSTKGYWSVATLKGRKALWAALTGQHPIFSFPAFFVA